MCYLAGCTYFIVIMVFSLGGEGKEARVGKQQYPCQTVHPPRSRENQEPCRFVVGCPLVRPCSGTAPISATSRGFDPLSWSAAFNLQPSVPHQGDQAVEKRGSRKEKGREMGLWVFLSVVMKRQCPGTWSVLVLGEMGWTVRSGIYTMPFAHHLQQRMCLKKVIFHRTPNCVCNSHCLAQILHNRRPNAIKWCQMWGKNNEIFLP